MELAILKEINKKYIEAVNYYEKVIDKDTPASPYNYINLAFLYWSFAFEFIEFDIPNNITEDWSVIGGNRYQKILELGLSNYPNNTEMLFWEKYFKHIIYGEDFSEKNCTQLLKKYGESKVPYFFLYLFNTEKYMENRNQLLSQCEELPTAKNNYIKSIIE